MKLGGSLGNVPQKFKETCYKNSIISGRINCTLENGLTTRNISNGTLPNDLPNSIKLL
jgi:hypothetical protein